MAVEPSTRMQSSPYKGLAHYEEQDARFFFGRDRDREIIRANLAARRLTLLYGESGVGKSSVLRAGVVHDLRERSRRDLERGRPPQFVPVVFSAWRDDPVAGLVSAVGGAVAEVVGEADGVGGSGLEEALQSAAARAGGELLLVLDQFEEYFLYHGDEPGPDTFAEAFPRAVNRLDLRARFLISIREDALAQLDRFKRRLPRLFENTLRISHLDLESARLAIEGPLALTPVSIEPALVETVLHEVQRRSTADHTTDGGPPRIEAPYLQLVMSRLWDEEARGGSDTLRLSTLEELGGAEEIIRTHLDTTLGTLPPAEQDVAAAALRFLVTSSGTKIAHTVPDLSDFTGRSADELRPVLDELSSSERLILNRLSEGPGDPGGARYEISHDVLAGAILDWRRRHQADELERKREEAERQAQRERRKARLAAGAAVAFLLLAAFAVAISVWAVHQKRVADSERQLARSRALLTAASDQLDKRLDRAIQLSLASYRERPSAETKSTLITAVERSDRLRRIMAVGTSLGQVASSRNGAKLALIRRGGVTVWDSSTWKRLGFVKVRNPSVAAFTPDGALLAVGGGGRVSLWDVNAQRQLRTFVIGKRDLENLVTALSLTADGRRITAVTLRGVFDLNARTGRPLSRRYRSNLKYASSVAVSEDGKLVAFAGLSGVNVIGTRDGRLVRHYPMHGPVAALSFASAGHRLGILDSSGFLRFADPPSRQLSSRFIGSDGTPKRLALGPQPGQLAIGWDDGHIVTWTNRMRTELRGHGEAIVGLSFLDHGKQLASTGSDGLAEVWTPFRSVVERLIPGGPGQAPLLDVKFGTTGLAASGLDRQIMVWRSLSGQPQRLKIRAARAWGGPVVLSSDGLSAGVWDGHAKYLLYDLRTSRTRVLNIHAPHKRAFAVGPDGRLAVGLSDGSIRIRGPKGLDHVVRPNMGSVQGLGFDPSGRLLASRADNGVSIVNVDEGHLEGTPIRAKQITTAAFSPDGTLLAYGTAGGSIDVWDVRGRHQVATITGEAGEPYALAFTPDGSTLAVGMEDPSGISGRIVFWDVKSRHRLGVWADPSGAPSGLDFSGDGRLLAKANASGTVTVLKSLLWNDVAGMQRRLCSVLGRPRTHCAS